MSNSHFITLLNTDSEILWQDAQTPFYICEAMNKWKVREAKELRCAFRKASLDYKTASIKITDEKTDCEYQVIFKPICKEVVMATITPLGARRFELTARQTQVLALLSTGLTQREIGEQLGISVFTIISHMKFIRTKLGIHTKAGLIRAAIENGLS